MRARIVVAGLAVVATVLSSAFAADPAVIDESLTGGGTMTEYSVLNQSQLSATQFDISAFTIATTGIGPTTTNLNWSSQALNSNSWSSIAMGGTNPNEPLTWQQYTGMTWNQAFPNNPFKVNGYFLSYIWNSGAQTVSYPSIPIFPGNPFKGGFFFQGTPSIDSFLVIGPTDSSVPQPLSDFQTFAGQSPWSFRNHRRWHSPCLLWLSVVSACDTGGAHRLRRLPGLLPAAGRSLSRFVPISTSVPRISQCGWRPHLAHKAGRYVARRIGRLRRLLLRFLLVKNDTQENQTRD